MRAFVDDYPGRTPGIAFRAITDGDLAFLAELYAETRSAELAPVPWPDEVKRSFLLEQFQLQHAHYVRSYPGADLLLITRNGEALGRVYVYRVPGEIRLMDIAIVPGARREGLGSALLAELFDEARSRDDQLTLHVEPNNPACALYRRLGFFLIEDRGAYLFLGWRGSSS